MSGDAAIGTARDEAGDAKSRVQSERERSAVCYVPRISWRVRASRPMTLQSPTKWYRVALGCAGHHGRGAPEAGSRVHKPWACGHS